MRIFVLLTVSLLLFVSAANQSLWLDEAISANVAKENSYLDIITKFSPADFHPPGYYLILKAWTDLFGYSAVSLRVPSIIFCLVTIYIVYRLGGIGAATLTAFNPLLVYYSHEARMYSLITMLMTMVVYLIVKKKYLFAGIVSGIGFLIFYGSVFLTASIGLYFLLRKDFKNLGLFLIGPVLALIIIWPLLGQQLKYSKEILPLVTNWDLVLGKVNLKNLLLIPMKFTSGRISFEPKIIYYLISGVFAVVVFSKLFKRNIYSFLFWMTLGIGVIFSIFTPMLQYFRFLYLVPLMGLIINKNKYITMGFLVFSLIYLSNSKFYREDWKSLVKDLPDKVYMIQSFSDPMRFYKNNITINDIRNTIDDDIITVVPYGEAIHGVDHVKILEKQGYKLMTKTNYRELSSESWSR